jgi:hypothetical protein
MNKSNHINDSFHMEPLEERNKLDAIEVGSHVYVAHLPYSVTHGYIITKKTDDYKFIMNGVSISANHSAIYKSKNEAINAMIRKLQELKDE